MTGLTLLEQAKRHAGTEVQRAVIEVFAASSPILGVLPFRNIAGNALKYNREKVLPGVAFRGINEGYTKSTGVLNPMMESLTIIGGDVGVDNFIIKTEGEDSRATHESMKIKAIAEDWQRAFFKGDSQTEPREMDGVQGRVVGTQIIQPDSPTSGGDAPSLALLDHAISKVKSPTHIMMNKRLKTRLNAAARDTTVGGFVNFTTDSFGRRVMTYDDLPILEIEDSEGEDTVLPFTEANPGGGAAASTSLYVVSIGSGMLEGIQNGGMDVRDIGEADDQPQLTTRIEWYAGMTVYHGRAISRYRGIKDVAWVA